MKFLAFSLFILHAVGGTGEYSIQSALLAGKEDEQITIAQKASELALLTQAWLLTSNLPNRLILISELSKPLSESKIPGICLKGECFFYPKENTFHFSGGYGRSIRIGFTKTEKGWEVEKVSTARYYFKN